MTERKHESEHEHFEQKLQRAYQQSKTLHPMPSTVKKHILQQGDTARLQPYQYWFRNAQLALGSVFLAVLGYLMLQPVTIPSYQIVVSYSDHAIETEAHSLTVRSMPAVVAQFSADENQQRYQQMLLAQDNISQFHAEYGVLQKVQQQWQITVCNQLAVTIDDALLQQLKTYDVQLAQRQVQQNIAFYRGPQGQILAIKPADRAQQCPVS